MDEAMMDINEWEPRTINHLISPHTQTVRHALEAFWEVRREGRDHVGFGPTLLYGPAYLGRRLTARIIAHELGLEVTEVLVSDSLWRSSEIAEVMLDAQRSGTALVVLCELSSLPRGFESALYSAIRSGVLCSRSVTGRLEAHSFKIARCPIFVVCGQGNLCQRVIGQFRLILRFDPYPPDLLTQVVGQRAKALGWSLRDDAVALAVKDAKGRPGWALQIIAASRMLAREAGKGPLAPTHIRQGVAYLKHNWPPDKGQTKSGR
ncbi:MAG: hypothetical protein GXY55_05120 [Phycisphaerae bacterium]|nr:hypothetical protein [Phycisphaerae bacterium]